MIRLQTYPHVVKGLLFVHSMLKIGEPRIAGTIDATADMAKGKKTKTK
jgi:hypothetical protein